jgi:hypothetical protein
MEAGENDNVPSLMYSIVNRISRHEVPSYGTGALRTRSDALPRLPQARGS